MTATGMPLSHVEVVRRVGLWHQALERNLQNQALRVACPSCGVVPGCPCSSDEDRLLPRKRLHQARAQLAWRTNPIARGFDCEGQL